MNYIYFLSCNHLLENGQWGFTNFVLTRNKSISTNQDITELTEDLRKSVPGSSKVVLMNFILMRTEPGEAK